VADLDANLSPTLVAIDLTKNDIGTVKYNIRDANARGVCSLDYFATLLLCAKNNLSDVSNYSLYPIFRRNSFLPLMSASVSIPFVLTPSMMPMMPRP